MNLIYNSFARCFDIVKQPKIAAHYKEWILDPLTHMGWRDVVDILLLSFLLFEIFRFFRTRRAGRMLTGTVVIVAFCVAVSFLKLPVLSLVAKALSSVYLIMLAIIFQPEIRTALERIGNGTVFADWKARLPKRHYRQAKEATDQIVDAVFRMADQSTGALIVIEGLTKLGECVDTGKTLNADIISPLLQNIFFDKSPLHDGALVIRNFRILAASCVLPAAKGNYDFGTMGTRHRAAIGVSEISDALVIVVSEQSGVVSVAQSGKMLRCVDKETLTDILLNFWAGNLTRKRRGKKVPGVGEKNLEWFFLEHGGKFLAPLPKNPERLKNTAITIPYRASSEKAGKETEESNIKDTSPVLISNFCKVSENTVYFGTSENAKKADTPDESSENEVPDDSKHSENPDPEHSGSDITVTVEL